MKCLKKSMLQGKTYRSVWYNERHREVYVTTKDIKKSKVQGKS